jgi:phytoene synthase
LPIDRVRTADRDRYLATLFAPASARAGLFALHALDLELAQVVATTTEPLLGEIRLAWWREQLDRLDSGTVPAQPTLAALAMTVIGGGISGKSLSELEAAHMQLLSLAHFDAESLDLYLEYRGGIVFGAAAKLLGGDGQSVQDIGKLWALADLLRRGERSPYVEMDLVRNARRGLQFRRHPKPLGPLAALASCAAADVDAVLADKPLPPRGTAGRQLRMAWIVLTTR